MFALVLSLAGVAVAWIAAALALMRAGRWRPGPEERFDAIVVLGARVHEGGAGPALRRRVDLACELFLAGHAPKIVVTGGRVGSPVAEADAARAYIAARALVPLDVLVLETEAMHTRDNVRRVRSLLGDAHVLVVTCAWHVPRARRIFARVFTNAECAGAPGRIRGALREVPATLWSWVTWGSRLQ